MTEAHHHTDNTAAVVISAPAGVHPKTQKAQKMVTALFTITLGIGLLAVTGFASSAHDVAHDARHAFSFPCH